MSKEQNKISLIGSNGIENISIIVDESGKKINILRQNINKTFQETYYLDSLIISNDVSEIKTELKEDDLPIKNNSANIVKINSDGSFEVDSEFDNRVKTLETKVNVLESKVD